MIISEIMRIIKKVSILKRKDEEYCECGEFLYFSKKGWISFSKHIKVSSNGKSFKVKCSCGKIREFNLN